MLFQYKQVRRTAEASETVGAKPADETLKQKHTKRREVFCQIKNPVKP
jgi:hypothetical protein